MLPHLHTEEMKLRMLHWTQQPGIYKMLEEVWIKFFSDLYGIQDILQSNIYYKAWDFVQLLFLKTVTFGLELKSLLINFESFHLLFLVSLTRKWKTCQLLILSQKTSIALFKTPSKCCLILIYKLHSCIYLSSSIRLLF